MREILTDKHFIASKILIVLKVVLVITLFAFFIPLFVLPFFNHPCADDYISGTHLRDMGFYSYQKFIYENWGGRFAATFVGSLFVQNNFLYQHYYLHSVLLLALNFTATICLVFTLNKYVLQSQAVKKNLLFIVFVFVALTICCMPEPSTYIFWFSSAVTYHLPVILLQFEVALLILFANTKNDLFKIMYGLLIAMLVFGINGFNELFIVVHAFLFAYLFFTKQYKRFSTALLIFVLIAFISSAIIVISSPGNAGRQSIIVSKSFITAMAAVLYELSETLWNIFKSPLFWFCAVIVYVHALLHKHLYAEKNFIKAILQRKILFIAAIPGFAIITIAAAVIALKGGIIPDRYLDGVCYFLVIILFAFVFIFGVATPGLHFTEIFRKKQFYIVLYGLIIIGLVCNNYFSDAYKSIISAPVYNAIMSDREHALQSAVTNKGIAVLPDYNKALQAHLDKDYSKSSQTLYNLVQQKPSLIFFQDDLSTDYGIGTLKNFYKLDSITVIGK